jgi:hypothetical protein
MQKSGFLGTGYRPCLYYKKNSSDAKFLRKLTLTQLILLKLVVFPLVPLPSSLYNLILDKKGGIW